ncbi:Lactoylglutathione lyase / glyoxalase [Thalictrum thalictroides]|uniref:Lactoylglutathione lyase / glyoxalase n=1 Tax=Thalictrum thalictroides TaxID=46969 RepID=A0A7J6WBI0_THATH|nr:Lactoylglutathione lyase / glyoxalase [Thalictrum thalictroides]
MVAVEKKLKEMGIEHISRTVEEGGIYVDQLFFHDPDGFMIEICNCDNLPVIPLAGEPIRACSRIFKKQQIVIQTQQPQQQQQVIPQAQEKCLPVTVKEDFRPLHDNEIF